tara:strand:- start:303 stop:488 length:186 start_codon:yes stop_codon:yes gene_type:complete
MTPKEKAIELVENMFALEEMRFDAKRCALICVDEIIKELDNCDCYNQIAHYKEVKQEIEKK